MTNQVCVRPVLYVNENDFDADTRARRLAERQPLERLDAIGARFLAARHAPTPFRPRGPFPGDGRRSAPRSLNTARPRGPERTICPPPKVDDLVMHGAAR
jgi:hypothetical protein